MNYKKINLQYINDIEVRENIESFVENMINLRANEIVVSKFFNPYEQSIIKDIAYQEYLSIRFDGGNENAERKIAIVSDNHENIEYINEVVVLRSEFDTENIKHPDVLGAILNQGIERNTIGDIVVEKNFIEFVCLRDISTYITMALKKIKNRNVDFIEKSDPFLSMPEIEYTERIEVVSSLRLDAIISAVGNMSRNEAKKLVQRNKVKVDFRKEDNPSYEVKEKSLISISRVGRFLFDEVLGKTKKNKIRVRFLKVV